MPAFSSRAANDAAKRCIEWIRYRYDKLHKPSAAARRQQTQQKAQPKQPVNHKEDIVNDLRDARQTPRAADLPFSVDYFVDGLRAKLTGNLIDSRGLASGRRAISALGNLCLNVAFNL